MVGFAKWNHYRLQRLSCWRGYYRHASLILAICFPSSENAWSVLYSLTVIPHNLWCVVANFKMAQWSGWKYAFNLRMCVANGPPSYTLQFKLWGRQQFESCSAFLCIKMPWWKWCMSNVTFFFWFTPEITLALKSVTKL